MLRCVPCTNVTSVGSSYESGPEPLLWQGTPGHSGSATRTSSSPYPGQNPLSGCTGVSPQPLAGRWTAPESWFLFSNTPTDWVMHPYMWRTKLAEECRTRSMTPLWHYARSYDSQAAADRLVCNKNRWDNNVSMSCRNDCCAYASMNVQQ